MNWAEIGINLGKLGKLDKFSVKWGILGLMGVDCGSIGVNGGKLWVNCV